MLRSSGVPRKSASVIISRRFDTDEAAAGRMKNPYDWSTPAAICASPAKSDAGSMMRRSLAASTAVASSRAGESRAITCREKTMPSAEASAIASETAQINDEANFSARSPLSLFAEPNIGMKHPAMAEAKRISKSESETDDAAIKAEASMLSAKTEPKSI